MKKFKSESGDEAALQFRLRATERIVIEMPKDVIESLERVAANRDMSYKALIKLYVGQGLRQDTSRFFADRVLQSAAEVLSHRVPADEVEEIVREIRSQSLV